MPHHWLPGALSIPLGLAVALLTYRKSIPTATIGAVALGFEVLSSFGLAGFGRHRQDAGRGVSLRGARRPVSIPGVPLVSRGSLHWSNHDQPS
jgi:hypothetical protein